MDPHSARRWLLIGALVTTASIPLQAQDEVQCPPAGTPNKCQSYRMILDAWTEFHASYDGFTERMKANLSVLATMLESDAIEGYNNTYNSRQQFWITSGQLFPEAPACDPETGDCPQAPDAILSAAQSERFYSCFNKVPEVTNVLLGGNNPSFNTMRGYLSRPNKFERAKKYCGSGGGRPPWWNMNNFRDADACWRDMKGAVDVENQLIGKTKALRDGFPADCDDEAFGSLAQYERDNSTRVLEFLGDSACAKHKEYCKDPMSPEQVSGLNAKLANFKRFAACPAIKNAVGDPLSLTSNRWGFIGRVSNGNPNILGAIESYVSARERLDDMAAEKPKAEATQDYLTAYRYLLLASMNANVMSHYFNEKAKSACK